MALTHSELVLRYRMALIKSKLKPLLASNTAFIDIVVRPEDSNRHGEFDLNGTATKKLDEKFYANESNAQVGQRILDQISSLAELALFHQKKNKHKDIVRISTSEFYFWPHKKRGPLPATFFSFLLKEIEALAKLYPATIHLNLGTFPVLDEKGVVHNNLIYVECGPYPNLTVITKTKPSHIDIEYPNTKTVFLTGDSRGEMIANDLSNICDRITVALNRTHLNHNKLISILADLREIGNRNPDYPPPAGYNRAIFNVNSHLRNHKSNLRTQTIDVALLGLSAIVQSYARNVNNKAKLIADKNKNTDFGITFANNTSKTTFKTVRTTAGHVIHVTNEICLDHHEKTAVQQLQQELKKPNGCAPLPYYVSHCVLSHSVELIEKNIASTHSQVIHADPNNHGSVSFDEKSSKVKQAATFRYVKRINHFGGSDIVQVFPPQLVPLYKPELLNDIVNYNLNWVNQTALRLVAENHPHVKPPVSYAVALFRPTPKPDAVDLLLNLPREQAALRTAAP